MLFDSDPKKDDAIALELIGKIELIDPIERALFPLLPLEDEKAATEWNELLAVLEARSLREFDAPTSSPPSPSPLWWTLGYSWRLCGPFRPDGELWKNLNALGILPFFPNRETDYL
jgi:hypothetical protein